MRSGGPKRSGVGHGDAAGSQHPLLPERRMSTLDILRKPIVTEKSTRLQESGRYVFEVAPKATKHQIRRAVEEAFDVRVVKVNTMNLRGKAKRFGPRVVVQRSWKKAIVTLAPGDTITIFEGV